MATGFIGCSAGIHAIEECNAFSLALTLIELATADKLISTSLLYRIDRSYHIGISIGKTQGFKANEQTPLQVSVVVALRESLVSSRTAAVVSELAVRTSLTKAVAICIVKGRFWNCIHLEI